MRDNLQKINEKRTKFTGVFVRYGTKPRYHVTFCSGTQDPTILLRDIKKSGKIITDHLWFNLTKQFNTLGKLHEGDVIEFYARVKQYVKGYKGRRDDDEFEEQEHPIELDYKLSHPTKIKVMGVKK